MATDHLDIVYNINQRIKELQEKIEQLKEQSSQKGKAIDNAIEHRIDKLNIQINELVHERNREIKKVRWSDKRQPKPAPTAAPIVKDDRPPAPTIIEREPSPVPVVERVPTLVPIAVQSVIAPSTLKVSDIEVGANSTTLTMVPTWFKPDNSDAVLNGIVYPDNTTERHQFRIVARYRAALGKSIDFIRYPLDVSEKSTETLILSLDAFAHDFGGQLSFTNRDLTFENSAEGAACGVPNLGGTHLLANDCVPTANFAFIVDLDYDKDLGRSPETMSSFVINFSVAVAQVLGCKRDCVRVFSVCKIKGQQGVVQVNFGLTTSNQQDTETLALKLQNMAKIGFGDNVVLQLVQLREYDCKWRSVLSYLELQPTDFDPRYNFDYTVPGLPSEQRRANQPYYLPLGWYRHALNVTQKYPDDTVWLGRNNNPGEWPVAFHGTHSSAVGNVAQYGLSVSAAKRNRMLEEAIQQKGEAMNRPGLYLTTHCNGGSDSYATTFEVKTNDEVETFQIVFQCRVEPNSFTIHTSCVKVGHGWRVVDPTAVRPYGLLLRKVDAQP